MQRYEEVGKGITRIHLDMKLDKRGEEHGI